LSWVWTLAVADAALDALAILFMHPVLCCTQK
jgi:hypothetical protein